MVTSSTTPPTARYPPPLVQQGTGPADVLFECDGQIFEAHKGVVCAQSQKLQDACDAAPKEGVTVTINADAYYAPTVKRMLEFLYHGEYDIGTAQESVKGDNDNKLTAFDVLSHVCCYAIGEDYQVGGLCAQALRNFSESLCTVSPDEFAEVMAAIATYTEAEPVHKALRNVAASRQNELAACKSFIKTLGCGHITIPATQDPGEARGLKAAKQLTVHGAELFRVANHTTAVANIEKAKLVKVYQAALRKIDQLRSQVDRDSSTLIMDERIHNDAKDALLASEATAKQAKEERLASEERASRMAQAIQKMKLDLEVLRNAEHNNKLAVEKANKEAATLRLALEETRQNAAAESATFLMALEASRVQAVCEQEKAADIQRQATDQREKSKMEASASQPTLAKVQYERDQALEEQFKTAQSLEAANQDLIALRMRLHKIAAADDTTLEAIKQERDQMKGWHKVTVQKLESANQEVADLQKRLNAATAENQVLHEQTMRDHIALSEGAKLLKASKQQNEAMDRKAVDTTSLRAEVNQTRLQNFTLQQSIYDLQFLILNDAESRQQLWSYGFPAPLPPLPPPQ